MFFSNRRSIDNTLKRGGVQSYHFPPPPPPPHRGGNINIFKYKIVRNGYALLLLKEKGKIKYMGNFNYSIS